MWISELPNVILLYPQQAFISHPPSPMFDFQVYFFLSVTILDGIDRVPTVREIQRLIEQSWEKFDPIISLMTL